MNTYIPCAALQPYVRILAVTEAATETTYKILPGTEVVLGFQFKGRMAKLDGNGQSTRLATAGITGIQNTYSIFSNEAGTGTVLVYCKEAGTAAFFKQPIHELFSESISLDNFMLRSELLIIQEKLCEATTDEERIQTIEEFLLGRLQQPVQDSLVMAALSLIHKYKGIIKITELAKQLHTSQSPLEKRFRQAVGATPKKFASIVRLKHTIGQYNPQNSLTSLGYEAGFYDQAHFIKQFKHLTGETPESFFSSQP